jgi:hypothetical protein
LSKERSNGARNGHQNLRHRSYRMPAAEVNALLLSFFSIEPVAFDRGDPIAILAL